jgi:hypothetical protein
MGDRAGAIASADPLACAGLVTIQRGPAVIRADPQCHMSDRIAAMIIRGGVSGWVLGWVTPGRSALVEPADVEAHEVDLTGAVLRIKFPGSPVVYRVEGRCAHGDWLLRFPD